MKKLELKQIIKEEIRKVLNENKLDLNTQIAVENFKNEIKGNYIIVTPAGKKNPEIILAYSIPQDIPVVKQKILKMMKMDEYINNDIYLGQIKWSSKDNDKVLSFINYQRGLKRVQNHLLQQKLF
jgi:hypothetical protein